jgi:hypothetical protein
LLWQIPPLNLSSDVEIVSELAFPLGPPTSKEPPKEKPPPPPTELSDDEVPPVSFIKKCVLLIYVIFKKNVIHLEHAKVCTACTNLQDRIA